MTLRLLLLCASIGFAQTTSAPTGPALPYHSVPGWAKLPAGWNLGECSGVAVDRNDNVWVFNRGPHPVIQFDKNGKMLKAWNEMPIKSSHGIRIDLEGNVWLIDVAGHKVLKVSSEGQIQMVIGGVNDAAGMQTSKNEFNRPTNIAFAPDGHFFVSDGYVNSRVVKFTKGGEYVKQWGEKGTGDNQFNIVHDVVFDSKGLLYVADRENLRIQIYDQDGKLLKQWKDVGAVWGLAYVPSENAIYTTDGRNDNVLKLNMDGKVVGVLGSHGRALGQFHYPHSIAVDSTGAIYVAEIRNWRVQKFVK